LSFGVDSGKIVQIHVLQDFEVTMKKTTNIFKKSKGSKEEL
jgi:hypothetical protein